MLLIEFVPGNFSASLSSTEIGGEIENGVV